jgi:hypothetical protein
MTHIANFWDKPRIITEIFGDYEYCLPIGGSKPVELCLHEASAKIDHILEAVSL